MRELIMSMPGRRLRIGSSPKLARLASDTVDRTGMVFLPGLYIVSLAGYDGNKPFI